MKRYDKYRECQSHHKTTQRLIARIHIRLLLNWTYEQEIRSPTQDGHSTSSDVMLQKPLYRRASAWHVHHLQFQPPHTFEAFARQFSASQGHHKPKESLSGESDSDFSDLDQFLDDSSIRERRITKRKMRHLQKQMVTWMRYEPSQTRQKLDVT